MTNSKNTAAKMASYALLIGATFACAYFYMFRPTDPDGKLINLELVTDVKS